MFDLIIHVLKQISKIAAYNIFRVSNTQFHKRPFAEV